MKSSLIFLLLLFSCSLVFAQQDSARATFHMKHREPALIIDKSNGVSFFFFGGNKNENFFIDNNGNAIFYWGKSNSPTSASFSNDTAAIDTIRSIITPAFITSINKCGVSDVSYGYAAAITVNGVATYFGVIEQTEVKANGCEYAKLRN